MRTNRQMLTAQSNQMDEFYTLYETIEKELAYYTNYFKGKRVYCNCDNPRKSNFWKYFKTNFKKLGLDSLISTFYGENACITKIYVKNNKLVEKVTKLKGNGDYRSEECIKILKSADIVVTNPPFSLTKYFIPLMYKYKKDFIVLGNQNILTFRDIYPLVLKGLLRMGVTIHSGDVKFQIPDEYNLIGNAYSDDKHKYARVTGIRWFTNLEHGYCPQKINLHSLKWNLKNNSKLIKKLKQKYGCVKYQSYDNYPAIEVPYTSAIPDDYDGVVGVPITFLDKYNPEQFKLVGFRKGLDGKDLKVNGKETYFRFLVQKRAV